MEGNVEMDSEEELNGLFANLNDRESHEVIDLLPVLASSPLSKLKLDQCAGGEAISTFELRLGLLLPRQHTFN